MHTRAARIASSIALAAFAFTGSPAHAGDFRFHGLLDIVAAERGPAYDHNILTRADSPFDAYGLRMFADATVHDKLQIFSQVVLRDATTPYVDGAYLMYTPTPARDFHVLAGKVPWLIGTWAPRTYSDKNPLVGAPLMYQYHSTLVFYEVVPSADALLATKGSGQYGINYFGYQEGVGMPIVDDCYWDVGVTLTGTMQSVEMAVGVVNGTPGWGTTSKEENAGKAVLGRIGFMPVPGLRLGVSGAYGPYLDEGLAPLMPTGKRITDFNQKLGMGDLEILTGRLELRAEGAKNIWQTPTVGNLEATSGYAEVKYSFPVGAFVAGRWDVLRFGDIADSSGVLHTWDADVTRWEAGVGYRFDRGTVAKIIHQRTRIEYESGDRTMPMAAAQVSVKF